MVLVAFALGSLPGAHAKPQEAAKSAARKLGAAESYSWGITIREAYGCPAGESETTGKTDQSDLIYLTMMIAASPVEVFLQCEEGTQRGGVPALRQSNRVQDSNNQQPEMRR